MRSLQCFSIGKVQPFLTKCQLYCPLFGPCFRTIVERTPHWAKLGFHWDAGELKADVERTAAHLQAQRAIVKRKAPDYPAYEIQAHPSPSCVLNGTRVPRALWKLRASRGQSGYCALSNHRWQTCRHQYSQEIIIRNTEYEVALSVFGAAK